MSGLYRRLYDQGLVNPGFGGEVLRVDGCCCILFTGESDQPDTVRQLLLEEIERIRSQGVDREIFTLCKNEKYGQLVENLENVEDAASQMADFALLGQTVAQQIEMLAGLTAEDADRGHARGSCGPSAWPMSRSCLRCRGGNRGGMRQCRTLLLSRGWD